MSATSSDTRLSAGTSPARKAGEAAEDVYVFPASFAQQRLWFLHELDPASSAYNLPILLRLAGELDEAALERAVNAIVARHETLRTTFALTGGEPVQLISPTLTVPVARREVEAPSPDDREKEALRLATVETRRPFDLRQGPLFRAHLWRLHGDENLLLLNMHHAVSDGWSFAVLLAELAELYRAFSTGQPSTLPDLRIQYADYAVWQRNFLSGEALERRLAHWKTRLSGAPERLALPTDRPRTRLPGSDGATESRAFSAELVAGVRRFSRSEGATPFMTMLAAFALLLHRLTGQRDFVIGSPIAGRTRPELENLVGLFINTLPLRVDLSGNPTARTLLARVRDVALDAYAHPDLPIEKLVEELRPHRDPARNPIFQTLFLHHRGFIQPFTAGALHFTPMRVDRGGSGEDLSLFLIDREGEGLTAGVEYKKSLFDAETVRGFLTQYETIVEGVLADPDTPIARVPTLSADQRRHVVIEWNRTEKRFDAPPTVHEAFEQQAARTPDSAAVVCGEARLTYRELDVRANRLARFLRRQGVGPESRVGICLDRSVELVVAILATLKAGAAYVPLDPSYPPERLGLLQADSGSALVLSRREISDRVRFPATRTIDLDAEDGSIARESPEGLPSLAAPEGLAYVLYTSGSTGRPKGVMVAHAALRNHMAWMQSAFPLDSSDRVLQRTPISFDASVWEFFAPLWAGATIVLGGPEDHRDVRGMLETIARHQVTVVQMVPGLLGMLLEEPDLSGCDSLRRVFCGGAPILKQVAERYRLRLGAPLVNLYGRTEATIDATAWVVSAGSGELVPIGRPISNTRIYVLDPDGEPVPAGVPGEIYIGGAALARGYWGHPDGTAAGFVPDGFSGHAGARLYRTGDRGKFRADGSLVYLGRMDDQVKIRGQRVEPGEVEAVLSRHPGVTDALVLARAEVSGDSRLVAYVVTQGDPPPGEAEFRRGLKALLPEAMIPSAFVRLDAMPRLPNGKVDRRALPAPSTQRAALQSEFLRARDDLEERLIAIWEKVLGIAPVGVRDDFFDLGGHSFLAMVLFSEMEKVFGRRLPLAILFQAPTVEGIASILREGSGAAQSWSALVPISPGGFRPPFYCVHAVGGNVLTYADLARRLGPDQPVYGLQAVGLDGLRAPHESLEEMARHYAAEIRRFQPAGPYALGGTSAGGLIAYEVARQLEAAGERVALLALFDTYAPGSIRRRPGVSPLRFRLYRIADRFLLHFQNFLAADSRGKAAYIAVKSRRLGNQLRGRWLRSRHASLPPALQKVQNSVRVALKNYRPGPYGGKVTLFRANAGPRGYDLDPSLGWNELAARGVEVFDVPGRHGALVYEPRVATLAKKLRACLDTAHAGPEAVANSSGARSA
ncbi:MAG: amino acid adenylation domain-containing protein [Thermoanaerobaculia bacterium]